MHIVVIRRQVDRSIVSRSDVERRVRRDMQDLHWRVPRIEVLLWHSDGDGAPRSMHCTVRMKVAKVGMFEAESSDADWVRALHGGIARVRRMLWAELAHL